MCTRGRQDDLAIISQLRAASIPLDEEVVRAATAAGRGLSLYGLGPGRIIELYRGGAGYCLFVGLRNNSERIISPHAYRLKLPWEEERFGWLEPCRRGRPTRNIYVWPDEGPHGFAAGEVLNNRLGPKGRLFPGDRLEGFLLGVGDGAIPENYRNGERARATLTVFDARGNRSETIVKLVMEKSRFRGAAPQSGKPSPPGRSVPGGAPGGVKTQGAQP